MPQSTKEIDKVQYDELVFDILDFLLSFSYVFFEVFPHIIMPSEHFFLLPIVVLELCQLGSINSIQN